MNTKLVIGVLLVAAALIIFYVTRPEEATAPIPESITTENQNGTNTTVTESVNTNTASTAAKPSTPQIPDSVTVVYDGIHFIPDTVTVAKGGVVRFMNNSDKKMWIGANNHPTHMQYPVKSEDDCLGSSFDQCTAVGTGILWSYTFTEVGTWGYHNHVRAQDVGSVTVVSK
jgi:plastocyanin